MDTSLPSDLIARFRKDLERLAAGKQRLGLAVSGGPDSLALLLLVHETCPGRFDVATVDHGLRPESAQEAAFVAQLCEQLKLPCEILKVEVAAGNLQHEARLARYRALGEWVSERKIDALLTAHHADDQAETLLMRLNRGSGLGGLAGVRARGANPATGGVVLRPLLGWRKTELEGIVSSAGIDPNRDPSNEDDRFDRARIRKALAQNGWMDADAIARSAQWLGQADDALGYYAACEWDMRVVRQGELLSYTPGEQTPREIRIRVLARAIAELGGVPRLSQVAELLDALEQGSAGNLAGVLAQPRGDAWFLSLEPPRKS